MRKSPARRSANHAPLSLCGVQLPNCRDAAPRTCDAPSCCRRISDAYAHAPFLAAVLLATFTSVFAVPSLSAVFRIDNPSPAANAEFGTGIASLGDQNGDGVPDFMVGVPGADRVDVFSGKDRTLIRSLHDPEGLTGLQFGYAVVGIGDVNGDSVEDIAVGAPGPFGFATASLRPDWRRACAPPEWGRVFVFSGATGALIRKDRPYLGVLCVRLLAGALSAT